MLEKISLQGLVKLAAGIGVVGAIGVNIGHRINQNVHINRPYCTAAIEALKENEDGVKMLGGGPLKTKNINLQDAELTPNKAKLKIPVKGKNRYGLIHTMSTRENTEDDWYLQYAVMSVKQGKYEWNVWLHPDKGITETPLDVLPDEIEGEV